MKLLVNYNTKLPTLLKGNYSYTNSDITDKNFPSHKKGREALEVELFEITGYKTSDEVIALMDKANLRPATIHELAHYELQHPSEQMIVALGSVWTRPGGDRSVGCLWGDAGGRRFSLYWFGRDWNAYYRFLAVRKYALGDSDALPSLMTYIKVDIKPKSINQLRKENPDLFYDQTWYSKEKFATIKPKAETLYIDPQVGNIVNKTWDEQQKQLTLKDEVVPTANQLIQCLIAHYKATGERLLERTYSRTSDVGSDGCRVYLGVFGADGLCVNDSWDDYRSSDLGLASSRKSPGVSSLEALDPLVPLNLTLDEITLNGVKYRRVGDTTNER